MIFNFLGLCISSLRQQCLCSFVVFICGIDLQSRHLGVFFVLQLTSSSDVLLCGS